MEKYDSHQLEKAETLTDFLQNEFLRRLAKNSQYSLRAFARDLGMSSSRLSEVMNGKRGISQKSLETIAESLKIKKTHRSIIDDLYFIQSSKSETIKQNAKARLIKNREQSRIKRLDQDKFRIMSDWYHTAIVELFELKNFKNDPAWIAKQLGITTAQAESAVQRLLSVGLLTNKDGVIKPDPSICLTSSETRSEAIINHHHQMLEKAKRSLTEDTGPFREVNSMMLAIPSEHLPQFRKEIQNFMQSFWQKIDKSTPKDALYAMNIHFFPVTKPTVSSSNS